MSDNAHPTTAPPYEITAAVEIREETLRYTLALLRHVPVTMTDLSSRPRFRPTTLSITWYRRTGELGEFLPWTWAISVGGPNVKADGSDGGRRHGLNHSDIDTDPRWLWAVHATRPSDGEIGGPA